MTLPARVYHFFLFAAFLLSLVVFLLTPQTAFSADSSFVSRNGANLQIFGKPYKTTGINAYQLATLWRTNAGCGSQVTDVDEFFKSLRPNSLIRMWAFQGSIGTNVITGQLDFSPLDRVVKSAEEHNQKLIIALSGQSGTCDDGHWKDSAWYQGGYRQVYNDDGRNLARLPFLSYAKIVAERYKNSPAVAMWEPVSEPEPSDCLTGYKADMCYIRDFCHDQDQAAVTLRNFFDVVGKEIKSVDPNHLIGSGIMGTGQCGTDDERYVYVHQSPYVDVASFHDYSPQEEAMPGDQWNGLKTRITQMKTIGKPIIVGEVGIEAANNISGCGNTTARRNYMKAKMDAGFKEGLSAFLPWSWQGAINSNCTFDIASNDPLMTLLRDYPLEPLIPTVIPTRIPTPTPTILPSNTTKRVGGLDMGGYCTALKLPAPTITNGNWKCGTSGPDINMSSVCIWQLKNQRAFAKQDIAGNQYSWSCYTYTLTTPTPTKAPTPTLSSGRLGSLDVGRYCATLKLPAPTLTNGNWKCGTGPNINMSSVCIWQYNLQNAYAKMDTVSNQYSWSCYK